MPLISKKSRNVLNGALRSNYVLLILPCFYFGEYFVKAVKSGDAFTFIECVFFGVITATCLWGARSAFLAIPQCVELTDAKAVKAGTSRIFPYYFALASIWIAAGASLPILSSRALLHALLSAFLILLGATATVFTRRKVKRVASAFA
jgi:hypothetical protein